MTKEDKLDTNTREEQFKNEMDNLIENVEREEVKEQDSMDVDNLNIFQQEEALFALTENVTFNMLNEEQQEELLKQLNPELYTTYIYDVDMDPQVLEKYMVGEYLYQPSDLYATKLLTNPKKNLRYFIISKEFQPIPDDELIDEYKGIELGVSGVLNCFKIVDISEDKDSETIQVTLLHFNSFEELAIKNSTIDVEKKAIEMGKDLAKTKKYVDVDIDLEKINYKISTAIGINNRESGLKSFTKGQIMFYLQVLSAIYENYDLETVFAFTDEYDITNIINIYQNSVEELRDIQIVDDQDYLDQKQQIINAYITTILNSLELSENLNPEEIKSELSEDFDKKNATEQLEEISEILDIPEDKLRDLINPN